MLRGGGRLLQIMTVTTVGRICCMIPQRHHAQVNVDRKIVGGNVLRRCGVRYMVLDVTAGPDLLRDGHKG